MTPERTSVASLPAPWRGFLQAIDARLTRPIELHCLGGFVIQVVYGLPRRTADIDFICAAPHGSASDLVRIAGRGTPLALAHHLYVDCVTVSDFPEDYDTRLMDLAPGTLSRLRLRALSAEDLVLAKLTRNSPKDVFDLRFLAELDVLDTNVLKTRYEKHLRPYLAKVDSHDLTLALWLDEIQTIRDSIAQPLPPPPPTSGLSAEERVHTFSVRSRKAEAVWQRWSDAATPAQIHEAHLGRGPGAPLWEARRATRSWAQAAARALTTERTSRHGHEPRRRGGRGR